MAAQARTASTTRAMSPSVIAEPDGRQRPRAKRSSATAPPVAALSRTLTRSLDNVPKKHRGKWAECLDVAADAQRDAGEGQRLRGDALVMVLPRLVLAPAVQRRQGQGHRLHQDHRRQGPQPALPLRRHGDLRRLQQGPLEPRHRAH